MSDGAFQLSMKMTDLFFDSPKVIDKVDRAGRRTLSKMGAFVRTRARSSIRRRKRISSPGEPPSAHSKDSVATIKNILFAYEPQSRQVVVGPVKLNQVSAIGGESSAGVIPQLLEFGGTATVREKKSRSGQWIRTDNRRTLRPGDEVRVRRATYRARRFMGPAVAAEAPQFPELFTDSVQ